MNRHTAGWRKYHPQRQRIMPAHASANAEAYQFQSAVLIEPQRLTKFVYAKSRSSSPQLGVPLQQGVPDCHADSSALGVVGRGSTSSPRGRFDRLWRAKQIRSRFDSGWHRTIRPINRFRHPLKVAIRDKGYENTASAKSKPPSPAGRWAHLNQALQRIT